MTQRNYRGAYPIALLRAAHRSATVRVTVGQGPDTFSGVVVGIGSRLCVRADDGEFIEDIPAERVVWADIARTEGN